MNQHTKLRFVPASIVVDQPWSTTFVNEHRNVNIYYSSGEGYHFRTDPTAERAYGFYLTWKEVTAAIDEALDQ